MKKVNGRSVTVTCCMFGNSLENLGKSPESAKTNIPAIFWNFWKSSEIFGKNRKMSQSAQDDLPAFFLMKFSEIIGSLPMSSDVFENLLKFSEICRKVLKITFQHFWNFFEIFGNCRKSSEIFGSLRKNRKMSESSQNNLPTLFENFRQLSEIFGSVRKCSENFGNPWKIFECNRRLMKIFLYYSNLWHLWTKDQIQEFWFVICTSVALFALALHFLHWCYSLIALLSANQNRVIFSCMLLVKI